MKITFTVNRKRRSVDVPPMKRLLDTLREDLGLTGAKEGCGEGECGACTVLLDGAAVNACLVPTCQVAGSEVTTIEGLRAGMGQRAGDSSARSNADRPKLHRLQQAFLDLGGAQCGICTPGMLLAASALPPRPSVEQIKTGLAGNLCRCTGYAKIVASVQAALGAPRRAPKRATKAPPGRKAPASRKAPAKKRPTAPAKKRPTATAKKRPTATAKRKAARS